MIHDFEFPTFVNRLSLILFPLSSAENDCQIVYSDQWWADQWWLRAGDIREVSSAGLLASKFNKTTCQCKGFLKEQVNNSGVYPLVCKSQCKASLTLGKHVRNKILLISYAAVITSPSLFV